MSSVLPTAQPVTKAGPAAAALAWREVFGPVTLYTGLALLLTYPLARQVGLAAAGFEGRDPFQHVWYQWWLKEMLLEWAAWPDRVWHLYYPLGAAHPVLALHPYVPLASLPVTLLFGPLVSYNLAFLLSFSLSGLAGYLLCRYVCGDRRAAFLGGLIFAFYPNRVGHAAAGHLLLITNYFLPLYALSLLVLLARPSPRRAIWHGVITALLALAQPTHIGYGIVPVFVFLVGGYLWRDLRGRAKPSYGAAALSWLVAANLLALLLFLPFAWPTLRQSGQGELDYLTPNSLTDHAADLLAFITPSPYNPILAKLGLAPAFSGSIISGLRDLEERLAYPGLIVAGLAGLAAWRRWRAARVWLGLAAAAALLSLGPLLKIGGQVSSIPLPYAWLAQLPFFGWSRAPGRLNETVMLALAVLAALGAGWLRARLAGRAWLRPGLVPALALLILAECLVLFPFPAEVRPVPSYYRSLAAENLAGGVLEMPVIGSRRASNYAMYYQTIHQHPLAGGYIERDPPGTVALKEFLNGLLSPLPPQTVLPVPDEAGRRAILAGLKIERVIVQPELMTDRAARSTLGYLPQLLGRPVFEDNRLLVYAIQPGLALPGGSGWQVITDQEQWEVVQDGAALRLKEAGYLFFYGPEQGTVELTLQPAGPTGPTRLSLHLNGRPAGTVAPGPAEQAAPVSLSLRPGFNYLYLSTEPPQVVDFQQIGWEQ